MDIQEPAPHLPEEGVTTKRAQISLEALREANLAEERTDPGDQLIHVSDLDRFSGWIDPKVVEERVETTPEIDATVDGIIRNYLVAANKISKKQAKADIKMIQKPIERLLYSSDDTTGLLDAPVQLAGLMRAIDESGEVMAVHDSERAKKFAGDCAQAFYEIGKKSSLTAEQFSNLYQATGNYQGMADETIKPLIKGSFDAKRSADDYSVHYLCAFEGAVTAASEPWAASFAMDTLLFMNDVLDQDVTADRVGPFIDVRQDHPAYGEVVTAIEMLSYTKMATSSPNQGAIFPFASRTDHPNYKRAREIEVNKAHRAIGEEGAKERALLAMATREDLLQLAPAGVIAERATSRAHEIAKKLQFNVSDETIEWFIQYSQRSHSELSRNAMWAYAIDVAISSSIQKSHASQMQQISERAAELGIGDPCLETARLQPKPFLSFPVTMGVMVDAYGTDRALGDFNARETTQLISEMSDHLRELTIDDSGWTQLMATFTNARNNRVVPMRSEQLHSPPVPFSFQFGNEEVGTILYLRPTNDLEENLYRRGMLPILQPIPFMHPSLEDSPSVDTVLNEFEALRAQVAPEVRRWPTRNGLEISTDHDAFALSGICKIIARQSSSPRYTEVSFQNGGGDAIRVYLGPELEVRVTQSSIIDATMNARLGAVAITTLREYLTFDPDANTQITESQAVASRVRNAIVDQPAQLVRLPVGHNPGPDRIEAYRTEKGGNLELVSEERRSTDPQGLGRAMTYRKAFETPKKGTRRLEVPDATFDQLQ